MRGKLLEVDGKREDQPQMGFWQLKACHSYYQESIAGGVFNLRVQIIFPKFSRIPPGAGLLCVLARGWGEGKEHWPVVR